MTTQEMLRSEFFLHAFRYVVLRCELRLGAIMTLAMEDGARTTVSPDLECLEQSVACLSAEEGLLAGVGIDAALLERIVYARQSLTADEHVAAGIALRNLSVQTSTLAADSPITKAVAVLRTWQFSGHVSAVGSSKRRKVPPKTRSEPSAGRRPARRLVKRRFC